MKKDDTQIARFHELEILEQKVERVGDSLRTELMPALKKCLSNVVLSQPEKVLQKPYEKEIIFARDGTIYAHLTYKYNKFFYQETGGRTKKKLQNKLYGEFRKEVISKTSVPERFIRSLNISSKDELDD